MHFRFARTTRSLRPPREACHFGIDVHFMGHLGLEPLSPKRDRCAAELPLRSQTTDSRGHVNGGTAMDLSDFTVGTAARSHDPSGHGVVTIDRAAHSCEPVRSDATVAAHCRRRGRAIASCGKKIVDDGSSRSVVERPDTADDPRFSTDVERAKHRAAIAPPLRDPVFSPPYRMDGKRLPLRQAPPTLGEGALAAPRGLLSLSDDRLEQPQRRGVLTLPATHHPAPSEPVGA